MIFLQRGKAMRHSAVISSKGQLVIPVELRKKYRLNEGVRVFFSEDDEGHLTLRPSIWEEVQALKGMARGLRLVEDLAEERRKERAREDAP
jgi:AbrB family looped-hinge helix DNA binding protein